jgi:hypothetical protein
MKLKLIRIQRLLSVIFRSPQHIQMGEDFIQILERQNTL